MRTILMAACLCGLFIPVLIAAGCKDRESAPKAGGETYQTGVEHVDVIEVQHRGKTYVLARWHNSYGSDMKLLDVIETGDER